MLTKNRQGKTLILGIGNPLMGDDGAGIRIADELTQYPLPDHVIVEEAGLPGLGLPAWLEGWSSVILIDAVDMGLAPGAFRRFHPAEVRLFAQDGVLSLHQPDLANGLALSEALDILPEEVIIYGIQPAHTIPGQELSQAVHSAIPDMINTLLEDIRREE